MFIDEIQFWEQLYDGNRSAAVYSKSTSPHNAMDVKTIMR